MSGTERIIRPPDNLFGHWMRWLEWDSETMARTALYLVFTEIHQHARRMPLSGRYRLRIAESNLRLVDGQTKHLMWLERPDGTVFGYAFHDQYGIRDHPAGEALFVGRFSACQGMLLLKSGQMRQCRGPLRYRNPFQRKEYGYRIPRGEQAIH